MALCCKVVNLGRTDFAHHLKDGHGVAQVAIVEVEVFVSLKMGYTFAVVNRRTADDAVHFITFL